MKKCGWKEVLVDGEPEKYVKTGLKFCPCKNFNGIIYWQYFGGEKRCICSACHGDTRKPEPEKPLIVKSGGSPEKSGYVAFWEEINYIYTAKKQPLMFHAVDKVRWYPGTEEGRMDGWKSFTGENPDITELTDELAVLRPKVIKDNSIEEVNTLWGVALESANIEDIGLAHLRWIHIDRIRLATAHELQETE